MYPKQPAHESHQYMAVSSTGASSPSNDPTHVHRASKRMLHFILELKLSNSRLSLGLASLRAVYDSHLAFGKIKGLNTNIFSTSDTESCPNI